MLDGDPNTVYVFDMDGTLADCDHRVHLAQAGQWDEFHSLLHLDAAHEAVADMFYLLNESCITVIITGRPEAHRQATLKWLNDHSLEPDALLMRPDDDYSKDVVLKLRLLYEYFNNQPEEAKKQVAMIFEDRDGVVEAYRNAGFTCAQVRNGSY